jgi:hypothetical protein
MSENKCEKEDVKKVLVPKISIIIQSKLILRMNKGSTCWAILD